MYPFELSGGLRQRAMIAMALVCRPALLIADEPTTALDVSIQAQILKLIRNLQDELGMAVLMITHDLGVVANVAEEVVVMYHGEIMERGTVHDIYENPQHPYLKGLMQAVPHFDMKPGERLVPLREIEHRSSATMAAKEPWPADADAAGPLLDVRNVTKRYTTRKGGFFSKVEEVSVAAVNDVSFQIQRGECFGLVGESGSGKTSVSKLVMRAVTPDEGQVVYNDRGKAIDLLGLEGEDLMAFRRKVQMVFQDPFGSLNPRMTVFDVIREPLIIHELGDITAQRELVQELMQLVGLDPRFLSRYPHSFSGGQRQRISARARLADLNMRAGFRARCFIRQILTSSKICSLSWADRICLSQPRGRRLRGGPMLRCARSNRDCALRSLFKNPVIIRGRCRRRALSGPRSSAGFRFF